jgi:hypothetical protein
VFDRLLDQNLALLAAALAFGGDGLRADGGLSAEEAMAAPVEGSDAANEVVLGGAKRLVGSEEIGEEGVKGGRVFIDVGNGEGDVGGADAVFEGIGAGDGFAGGGARAGGAEGVAAIGGDLGG